MNYNKDHFLNWYLNTGCDQEQKELIEQIGKKAVEQIKNAGFFTLKIDDLYKESKEVYNDEHKNK
jgi:hypothetical protein